MKTYAEAEAYLGKKSDRPAPSGSSVRIVRQDNGDISVIYHRTPVVTYRQNGTTVFFAGGWATRTTAQQIMQYSDVRAEVRRYARTTPTKGAQAALKRGENTIGPDRCGHGDALLLTAPDGSQHLMDRGAVTMQSREMSRLLRDVPRRAMPTYDCKCKMCRTGTSSWQSAIYA